MGGKSTSNYILANKCEAYLAFYLSPFSFKSIKCSSWLGRKNGHVLLLLVEKVLTRKAFLVDWSIRWPSVPLLKVLLCSDWQRWFCGADQENLQIVWKSNLLLYERKTLMQWAPAYSNKIYPLFSSGFVTLHSVHVTGMPRKHFKLPFQEQIERCGVKQWTEFNKSRFVNHQPRAGLSVG